MKNKYKFKAGDKVVLINNRGYPGFQIGDLCIIENINPKKQYDRDCLVHIQRISDNLKCVLYAYRFKPEVGEWDE